MTVSNDSFSTTLLQKTHDSPHFLVPERNTQSWTVLKQNTGNISLHHSCRRTLLWDDTFHSSVDYNPIQLQFRKPQSFLLLLTQWLTCTDGNPFLQNECKGLLRRKHDVSWMPFFPTAAWMVSVPWCISQEKDADWSLIGDIPILDSLAASQSTWTPYIRHLSGSKFAF